MGRKWSRGLHAATVTARDDTHLDAETRVDFYYRISERRSVATAQVTEVRDEAVLVDAARAGDRAAFGRLYDRYARVVHGIILARVPHAEVDDLVHDVFLLALRRLKTLRDAGAFGAWLGAIARNRATDYFRRARVTEELAEDVADENRPQAEARAALDAIRTLPEAYRETLIFRLVEGLTGPEIAARTGLTPGSVRVNLHRGMHLLREKLAKRDDP